MIQNFLKRRSIDLQNLKQRMSAMIMQIKARVPCKDTFDVHRWIHMIFWHILERHSYMALHIFRKSSTGIKMLEYAKTRNMLQDTSS